MNTTEDLIIRVGREFRAARERRGLTVEQAADILGIGDWYLDGVETGNGNLPSILLCHRAVDLLGADPEALFGLPDYERRRMADNLEVARAQCRRAQDKRDAAVARAEGLAAECEAISRELGRVRAERDAIRLLSAIRDEDPDVDDLDGGAAAVSACTATRTVQCAGCGKSAPAEPGRIPRGWIHYSDMPKCGRCQRNPSPELRAKERAARARDRRRHA